MTFSQKLEILENELHIFLHSVSFKVTDNDYCFNLSGGRWLVGVENGYLVDNEGYLYNFQCLKLNELVELCDYAQTIL